MAEVKLAGEKREEFGKGASRRIRRDHKIPAVVYGHGMETMHITLPGHETMLALRLPNVLMSIAIPGEKAFLAIPKQIQRHPILPQIEHVDLLVVKKGEKVTVDIPVLIEGEAEKETLVTSDMTTISLAVESTDIPENVVVDITGLPAGSQILAKDVVLPEGATLECDEDLLVVNITQQISAAALEADLETPDSGAADAGATAEEAEAE